MECYRGRLSQDNGEVTLLPYYLSVLNGSVKDPTHKIAGKTPQSLEEDQEYIEEEMQETISVRDKDGNWTSIPDSVWMDCSLGSEQVHVSSASV